MTDAIEGAIQLLQGAEAWCDEWAREADAAHALYLSDAHACAANLLHGLIVKLEKKRGAPGFSPANTRRQLSLPWND